AAATTNQAIESGAMVVTGFNGRAVLRFDDSQVVALGANTTFRIDEYRYDAAKPSEGRVLLDLVKGTLRAITGLIARANHQAFALRVPQATIGIRGTDFLVGTGNQLFVSVNSGEIAVTNDGGTTLFGPGQLGGATSTTSLPAGITASQLPSEVSQAFSELNGLGSLGGLSGGAGGTGAEGGGMSKGTAALIGLGVIAAGAAAAAGGGGGSSTTHH
ncbi:MAG TPA: FecR family protein, partial [Burkholderiales bacterium]|nr:FecR family protein [Burkholderiales bacterium]